MNARGIRWIWISMLVIVADQLTKWWVVHNLAMYERIDVAPVLAIYRTFNTGAAWSFLADAGGWQRWGFSVLAFGVSIALVIYLSRTPLARHRILLCGITLILGGAVGNLIDRVLLGHVVDFVLAHWGNANFPAFNIADAAISVGAVLVGYDMLFLERQRESDAASGTPRDRGR
jgi:signal peptidase II